MDVRVNLFAEQGQFVCVQRRRTENTGFLICTRICTRFRCGSAGARLTRNREYDHGGREYKERL